MKSGAHSHAAVNGDITAHFFDDSITDGKPQTQPLADVFGGKKRVGDPFNYVFMHAHAFIANRHDNPALVFVHGGGHLYAPVAIMQRVQGILDQINHHLFDLLRIPGKSRDARPGLKSERIGVLF